jgi:hypothetical protein
MILTWLPTFVDKANLPIPIARIQFKYHTARVKVRFLWLVFSGCKPRSEWTQTQSDISNFARMKNWGRGLISDIFLSIITKRILYSKCPGYHQWIRPSFWAFLSPTDKCQGIWCKESKLNFLGVEYIKIRQCECCDTDTVFSFPWDCLLCKNGISYHYQNHAFYAISHGTISKEYSITLIHFFSSWLMVCVSG